MLGLFCEKQTHSEAEVQAHPTSCGDSQHTVRMNYRVQVQRDVSKHLLTCVCTEDRCTI